MGLVSFFLQRARNPLLILVMEGVQSVVRDSIPSTAEVRCSEEPAMSSMSIGMVGEYLFIVTPIDLVIWKVSIGVVAINNDSFVSDIMLI